MANKFSKKHYTEGVVPAGRTSLAAEHKKNRILFLMSPTSLTITITMPDTYHDIEDRISEAIQSLDNQRKPNIAKTARNFRVPPSRLRNRWNGRQPKSQVVAHNRTLSEAQELAICQYLDHLDREGPKARYKQLEQAANALLKKDYTGRGKPPTVGSHWAGRFLQRHSQYFVRKQKP